MRSASSANIRFMGGRLRHEIFLMDFSELSRRISPLFRVVLIVAALAIAAGLLNLLTKKAEYLPPFLEITLSALGGVWIWTQSKPKGLPFLPMVFLQHAVVYGLPLAVLNATLDVPSGDTISTAGAVTGFFLLCCLGGWSVGRKMGSARPSRGNLLFAQGGDMRSRCFSLALVMLAASVTFQLCSRTGLIFSLLPGGLFGLYSVLRTFSDAASMLGALLGGLVIGELPRIRRGWIYWVLLAVSFFLSAADLLVSGASIVVLSAAIGLAFGKRGIPWLFLLVALAMVGFLNQGKFVMRERYWGPDAEGTNVSLTQLPALYAEWVSASAGYLFGSAYQNAASNPGEDEGQSIFDRVDSLQNLTYVIDALNNSHIPVLEGATYAVIPPLFIPRFLWPDKPRTHEGQIMLNLRFGRQASIEATETTYVAWGFLPEAIGNFGIWPGTVLLGLVIGWILGWLEKISLHKRLFSIEGAVLCVLLMLVTVSYEMVASVFLTATFQLLIAVVVGGAIMRMWFGRGGHHSPRIDMAISRETLSGATGTQRKNATH